LIDKFFLLQAFQLVEQNWSIFGASHKKLFSPAVKLSMATAVLGGESENDLKQKNRQLCSQPIYLVGIN
jgi:hypothetical protein